MESQPKTSPSKKELRQIQIQIQEKRRVILSKEPRNGLA